jgi:hypothetical protein
MFVLYVLTGLGEDIEPDLGQIDICHRVPAWCYENAQSLSDCVWLVPNTQSEDLIMRIRKTDMEYRVDVAIAAPGQPNGLRVQSFNHDNLDDMWRTVTTMRGKQTTRQIRVYTLLAIFEV